MSQAIFTGLDGVVVTESSICTVGLGSGLNYRGFNVIDLCEKCECFEEVAHLLIYGWLPTAPQLSDYLRRLQGYRRSIPQELITSLELISPSSHPMDVVRTASSLLGCLQGLNDRERLPKKRSYDDDVGFEKATYKAHGSAFSEPQEREVADKAMVWLSCAVLYWWIFSRSGKRIDFTTIEAPTLAGLWLRTLAKSGLVPDPLLTPHSISSINSLSATSSSFNKQRDELKLRAIECSMICYAEHDLNASTFAARVTASTGSDLWSAFTTAIGTLRGPLHGGANEAAMEMLLGILKTCHQDNLGDCAEKSVRQMWEKKQLVMGFGHRIYKNGDPRSPILKRFSQQLSASSSTSRSGTNTTGSTSNTPSNTTSNTTSGNPAQSHPLFQISETIENLMTSEKKIYPNADFYAATVYHFSGIPTELFTPLFAVARISGWAAHVIEQRRNNRLIRPKSLYIGPQPGLKITPLKSRL